MSAQFNRLITICLAMSSFAALAAEDKIELDTTVIKGNTELPKILYVVPWQDTQRQTDDIQQLTLHSLYGNFFEPVAPQPPKTFTVEGGLTKK